MTTGDYRRDTTVCEDRPLPPRRLAPDRRQAQAAQMRTAKMRSWLLE